ncbi:hypothetical protein V6Z12_A02G100200 [Gossypium hirsutum]
MYFNLDLSMSTTHISTFNCIFLSLGAPMLGRGQVVGAVVGDSDGVKLLLN